jgi:hypothetical protein
VASWYRLSKWPLKSWDLGPVKILHWNTTHITNRQCMSPDAPPHYPHIRLMYTLCNKIMFWNQEFNFLRCYKFLQMLVPMYQIMGWQMPEDINLHCHCSENPKSHMFYISTKYFKLFCGNMILRFQSTFNVRY